jgi:hypothetical protein
VQGGVLTDLVRAVRDQGVGGRQYRIELRRLGELEPPGDALGEVVTLSQRECEERDRQETAVAEVERHDPAPGVPHEIGALHVTGAEAQAVFLDLGPEVDTVYIVPARVCENLCQESSSGNQRRSKRDKAGRRGNTYAVNMLFQLLDGMVSHGGLPFDEEAVSDRASADGSRLCGRTPDGDERLHGGGDELGVGVVACRPVDVFHYYVAVVARAEGEVDAGDPHGSVGVAVNGFPDEVLRQGLTHSGVPAILDPGIGGAVGLVNKRDAAKFVGIGVGIAALLDDRLGVQQVVGLVVGVNDELDLRHGGH